MQYASTIKAPSWRVPTTLRSLLSETNCFTLALVACHGSRRLKQGRLPRRRRGPVYPGVDDDYDYSQRAQWLRAAVLGANDGLLTTASLMMGVGTVKDDAKAMLGSGVAGLVAIGEFLLVAARFISSYGVRLEMTAAVTSIALMVFGCVGAALGRVPVGRSCLRVVLGGWLAMTVTFGLMRLFGSRVL